MTQPEPERNRGLRLHDLIGLVIGYGMAALLARSIWPKSRPFDGIPAIALGFDFCWLGLAMSGPIVLLLDRRKGDSPLIKPRAPVRPGRLISQSKTDEPPVGQGPVRSRSPEPSVYSKAELAWMVIGGYWIGLTMFVVPALSIDTPWALIGLLQLVAAVGLWAFVPTRARPGSPTHSWTHKAAVGLLWTWPFTWVFLILLGKSL